MDETVSRVLDLTKDEIPIDSLAVENLDKDDTNRNRESED